MNVIRQPGTESAAASIMRAKIELLRQVKPAFSLKDLCALGICPLCVRALKLPPR